MSRIFLIFALLLTACAPAFAPEAPTASPLPFFTPTLPVTAIPPVTLTAPTPTAAPTQSANAVTKTQVNVRAAPDVTSVALSLLPAGVQVQAIGRDATGGWIQIIIPENTPSQSWVTVEALEIFGGAEALPVVAQAAPSTSLPQTATPAFSASTASQINVRSGPASAFSSLGLLEANTPVILTGVNQIGTWYQIEYAAGKDERGWAAAAYLKISGQPVGLPVFDNDGNPLSALAGTTPTPPPAAYSAAPEDVDSAEAPAVRLTFASSGPRLITYSSDLSAPFGDAADWLEFTITTAQSGQATILYFGLTCSGNGGIHAELRQNGLLVQDFPGLVCGQYDLAVRVLGGQPTLLQLSADGSATDIRYVKYTLTISTQP